MAVEIGKIRKRMRVRTSNGEVLGRVAEVWLGTDPTSATARCDEAVCSRIEVHQGLVRKRVLFVPYNAIRDVSAEGLTLGVDRATARAKNWASPPRWLPKARVWIAPPGGEPPGSLS
jgi:hypothetical protein